MNTNKDTGSGSTATSISTDEILAAINQLRLQRHRNSTAKNYYGIWMNFNRFLIKLDKKPNNWEDRVVLFAAYLIQNKRKSTMVKSYISVIRAVLYNGGIILKEDAALLSSLTRACKLRQDTIQTRLPIRKSLLRQLLQVLRKKLDQQPYLCMMYQALILTTYYGMFRIGELTASDHIVKVRDVHIAINKPKLLFILHSSKTHGKGDKPQMIKITGSVLLRDDPVCPFSRLIDYINIRKRYISDKEQFFVFRDRTPVTPNNYRKLLRDLIKALRLSPANYGVHGMCTGRSSDLLEMGVSIETIKKLGRWISTSVYTYLHN